MGTRKTRRDNTNTGKREIARMLDATLREAGVAEAVELYERAEAVYARVAGATIPIEFAATSTSEISLRG